MCDKVSIRFTVNANPLGTLISLFAKLLYISPKEEFFPPTFCVSEIEISLKKK